MHSYFILLDIIQWSHDASFHFTTQSAYEYLHELQNVWYQPFYNNFVKITETTFYQYKAAKCQNDSF